MAITVTEKCDSGELTVGDNGSLELTYIIRGTANALDAATALEIFAPATWESLARQNSTVEPVFVDALNPDQSVWDGRVRYGVPEKQEVGESSFSFDTSGGSQHITQSLATISNTAPAGKTAPNFKGAIGVTADSVDGVDITIPVYEFSETHTLAAATVDNAYKGKLFSLTGKVNNASFKGLAAGECLFLGASGSKRGDGDWDITFKFAGSPNRTNITVGDITVPAKKGWEYLWVRYEDAEDGDAKMIVKRPLSAHVEKVHQDGDFSLLGIGT